MPEFERVHRLLGDRVAFLGVSQSDAREGSIDLARETGITYDTAVDERGEFFRAVGGQGMPTTIFIRPGGGIAEMRSGSVSWTPTRSSGWWRICSASPVERRGSGAGYGWPADNLDRRSAWPGRSSSM